MCWTGEVKHGGHIQIPSMLESEMQQYFQFPDTFIEEPAWDDSDKVTRNDRGELDLLRDCKI